MSYELNLKADYIVMRQITAAPLKGLILEAGSKRGPKKGMEGLGAKLK